MTPAEKKEAYKAKQRAKEHARREALGLSQHPIAKPVRKARKAKLSRYQQGEFADAAFGTLDNLGESPDY